MTTGDATSPGPEPEPVTMNTEAFVPLESNVDIAPANGKLGILLPGMGAVGTTSMRRGAGVVTRRASTAMGVGPTCGGRPAMTSNSVAPSA